MIDIDKENVILKMTSNGLVAVVRASSSAKAERISDACIKGGCGSIELTFTVPDATNVIKSLIDSYRDSGVLIGAGTVLDSETARIAILAGAQFIVSPDFDADTAKLCNRYRIAYVPGVQTVKEAITAMEAGADIVKIFPGDLLGPRFIKDIKGPLPYAKLMPSGGVNVENTEDWIRAGAVAVSAGSSLTAGADNGDFAAVTNRAKEFITKIKGARTLLR